MKKITIFILFSIFFTNYSKSQVIREWVYDFNSSGIDYGYGHGVVCDKNNNVYVSGIISNGNSLLPTFMKMNNSGNLLFLDTISSGYRTSGNLIYDKKSTVFSSGYYLNALPNIFLEAFDTSGLLLWRQTYYRQDSAEINIMRIDKSIQGYLFAIGNYYDSLNTPHINLMKTDSLGNLIWMKSDSGTNLASTFPQKVIAGDNGKVFCIGHCQLVGSTNIDVFLFCYDENGNIIWYKTIDGTLHDFDTPWDIKLDSKNNIIISAFLQDTIANLNSFLAKYDTLGNEIWRKSFEGVGSRKFVVDKNDQIYFDNGLLSSGEIFGIVKLDSAGNVLTNRNYSLPNYSMFDVTDLVIDDSSNIYLTGIGFSNTSVYDFVSYKVDSGLNDVWNDQYLISNTLGESPYALALDNNNNLFVVGQSNYDQVSNTSNLCVVKYGNYLSTGTMGLINAPIISIFPNPTTGNLTIDLGSIENEFQINITDFDGRLINKYISKTLHEVILNDKDFPKGVYIINITSSNINVTKRIIKM